MPPAQKISLREGARQGIIRLRQPQWASSFDHVEITALGGVLGIWVRLWAPFNEGCNGQDPVAMLVLKMDPDGADWLPYEGKLPDSPEYLAERASFKGCLKEK